MTSYVRAPLNFAAHQRATVGDQKISFTTFDHLGWMKCDGRAVSRATYALMFNVIGTTFGAGDGSTTFNLPNYQGCVPGMAGQPPFNQTVNNTTYTRGQTTGEQRHLLTVPEMPTHNHGTQTATAQPVTNYELTSSVGDHNHTGSTGINTGTVVTDVAYENNGIATLGSANVATSDTTETHTHTISGDGAHNHTLQSQGLSQYHNNMQPTLFGGNMYIFTGRMTTTRAATGGVATYPYAQGTDLA